MSQVPNPAAVPGIMPSEIAGAMKDLPVESDPHFGTETASDAEKPEKEDDGQTPVKPEDR